ncbi:hypothetical protein Bb109J_c3484 [Bdellovibrio bacteriovorus]|uniref:S1 family peptidase n=1 Tax=Bdellovibrio bacteriovorus TaxID=959 RepID=UPI00045C0578|nr:trypsin-like serine protease [Bdellovibrio bacteriovorus]AHZ85517.1 hypothetical protein EP01_11305 [Bdellovibrio bacteriovorus]BEV70064.1 hypothetical protein Bb109J_c3484 [Bdellovibrio bacteriovorus]
MLKLSVCFLIFFVLGCQKVPQRNHEYKLDASIIGGKNIDSTSARALSTVYVGISFLKVSEKVASGKCTGSIIAPRAILTAAHCFHRDHLDYDSVRTYVAFGADLTNKSSLTVWTTEEVVLHPKYIATREKGNDLAVIRIGADVPNPFRPVKILSGPFDSIIDLFSPLIAVGYGVVSEVPKVSSSFLKEIELPISEVAWSYLSVRAKADSAPCFGDSGGPVFKVHNNVNYLVGNLTSGYGDGGLECGSVAHLTRLDIHADFLKPYLK